MLGVGALNLAGNCYSKCREPGSHTQLFLLHSLTGAGVRGRVRSPISDVSNLDKLRKTEKQAGGGGAEWGALGSRSAQLC